MLGLAVDVPWTLPEQFMTSSMALQSMSMTRNQVNLVVELGRAVQCYSSLRMRRLSNTSLALGLP